MTTVRMSGSGATTRSAGLIMARLDAPYAGKTARSRAVAAAIVIAILASSLVIGRREISDSAFRAYSSSAEDVGVTTLLAHPDLYQGRPVHVRGFTSVVYETDIENQFILTDPAMADLGQASATTPPTGPIGILVLTPTSTGRHEVVDVWGTLMGTTLKPSVAQGLPVPVLRAEYVRPGY